MLISIHNKKLLTIIFLAVVILTVYTLMYTHESTVLHEGNYEFSSKTTEDLAEVKLNFHINEYKFRKYYTISGQIVFDKYIYNMNYLELKKEDDVYSIKLTKWLNEQKNVPDIIFSIKTKSMNYTIEVIDGNLWSNY